jgi:hypothetical protein
VDHKIRAGWATAIFAIGLGVLLTIGFAISYDNFAYHYSYVLHDDNRAPINPVITPQPAGDMDRVLLIVVEGGRADALENPTLAGNISRLRQNGTRLGACTARFPTTLKPAVGSIYTGAAPFTHPYLTNTQILPAQMPCESLFRVACRQVGGETMFYGDPRWAELFSPYVNDTYTDLATFLEQYIAKEPLFAAVHLNATEEAGWAHGGNSPQYEVAVNTVDNQVGTVIESLETSTLLNKTLVVLTTTSGHVNALHTGRGGNGGEEPAVATTYAFYAGLGVNRDAWCNVTAHLEDIAPTIAYLMNWSLPTHSNGQVLYSVLNSTAPNAVPYQRNASIAIQLTERALGLLNATGNVLQVEKSPEMIVNLTNRLLSLKIQATAAGDDPNPLATVEKAADTIRSDIEELQRIWVEERVFKERFSRFVGILAVIFLIFFVALRIIKRHRFVIEKGQLALGFINAAILSGIFWLLTGMLGEYFTFSTISALFEPPPYPLLVVSAVLLGGAPLLLAWTRVAFIQRNGYAPENDFTTALGIHVMFNYVLVLWVTVIYGFDITFDFPSAFAIFPGYLPTFHALALLAIAPAFFGMKRVYDRLLRRWVKPKFEHVIDSREYWHIISRDEQAILEYRRRIIATAEAARQMEEKANNHDGSRATSEAGTSNTNGTSTPDQDGPGEQK